MPDSFLDGRVRRESLPLLAVPTKPDDPELRRLDLPQGQLAQISRAEVAVRYMAWAELRVGGIRGNHWHHRKEEWIYLIEGGVELIVEDRDSKEHEEFTMVTGDLVVIDPGVAHALRPVRDGQCIEYSPVPFDPEDTEAYPLV